MVKKHCDVLPECLEVHNDAKITMAEIKKDLTYIKDKLDENTHMIKEVIDCKAEKSDVNDLKQKYWVAVAGTISLLIAILFMLIKLLYEK